MAPFTRMLGFATLGKSNHRLIPNANYQHHKSLGTGSLPIQLYESKERMKPFLLHMKSDQLSPSENITYISKVEEPVEIVDIDEALQKNNETYSLYPSISIQAVIILNLVAIIWGSQHSVIKMVVDDCDAASFSFARFALATAIASPFTPNIKSFLTQTKKNNGESENALSDEEEQNALAWRWGVEMGMWMFLGYAFQAIGLEYTTAQRSGFLLYLNVKFVPFFANVLFGKQISISTWASAFTALAGTALIAYDGSSLAFNVGDLWSVAAAAASAMFILRLESATNAVKNSAALNAASLWMVTATAFLWCVGNGLRGGGVTWMTVVDTISLHPFELIYLGGITTALANYLQTKAQKGISAERASIIYALDPVYGEK